MSIDDLNKIKCLEKKYHELEFEFNNCKDIDRKRWLIWKMNPLKEELSKLKAESKPDLLRVGNRKDQAKLSL